MYGARCRRCVISSYGVRCGMRACFLSMGLGMECTSDFSVWGYM